MDPTSILAASTKSIDIIANVALLLFLSDAQSRSFHTRTAHSVCAQVFPGIPFILNCSNCGSLNRSPYRDKLAALSSALLFLYPAGRPIGDAKASVLPWSAKNVAISDSVKSGMSSKLVGFEVHSSYLQPF